MPVAVLSTDGFDARQIDPAIVDFASAPPARRSRKDVDGDGDVDVLFHFRTLELNLDVDSTEARLRGYTNDGQFI
jgi:hypothetical protein